MPIPAARSFFVDESSKDNRTIYHHYGRAPAGQRALVLDAEFVLGDRWSILPALSLDGYIAARVVPGSVDAAEFFDFITEDVVRTVMSYCYNLPCYSRLHVSFQR